jgi:hypothetical protein
MRPVKKPLQPSLQNILQWYDSGKTTDWQRICITSTVYFCLITDFPMRGQCILNKQACFFF